MTRRGRMFGCQILAASAALLGCGGSSMPTRQQVEREVERQAKASVGDHTGATRPHANCVEDTASARSYTCTLRVKIGKGRYYVTTAPQTTHAYVSKDGKSIVVTGL